MSVYKPCDVRGSAQAELTPELYRSWGRALGYRVEPGAKFVVGGDVRQSTPQFLAALVDGLCEAGVDVVDLGVLPTPMVYYARQRLQAAGCAMVTASHNPAEINGLKWMIGTQPTTQEDVEALRRAVETPDSPPRRTHTTPRTLDISFDYVAALQETWVDALEAQRRAVLDPMHGCFAVRARRYLHAIFPQCLFSTIHDTPDATFGGHSPDCSRPHLLEELCEAVYRERAHLGVAFDGDGDRIALVDGEGMVLGAEEATWVLLHTLGHRLRGQPFVHDVKFSDRIGEAARELGAEPVAERSGHAFIRARMRQADALFGAEVSGHYFFQALDGGDDGLYTACWLIAYLARTGESLAHLRRECPPVYITPDLRVPLEPPQQQSAIDQARAAWSEYPQQTIDGVRIDTPAGWVLVRPSVTESALTFRFESRDWPALDDLVDRFCGSLPQLGDEIWSRYRSAMGTARRRSQNGIGA